MRRLAFALVAVLGLVSVAVAQINAPSVATWTEVIEQPVTAGVKAGAIVAANGSDFGLQPGQVEVDCLPAVVTAWSPTRIAFVVPQVVAGLQQFVQVTIFTADGRYYRSMAFKVVP